MRFNLADRKNLDKKCSKIQKCDLLDRKTLRAKKNARTTRSHTDSLDTIRIFAKTSVPKKKQTRFIARENIAQTSNKKTNNAHEVLFSYRERYKNNNNYIEGVSRLSKTIDNRLCKI